MQEVGKSVTVTISEPWESTRVFNGIIIGLHNATDGDTYLLVEDTKTGEEYIVANRYRGENVKEIFAGKEIIVAIAVPKSDRFIFGASHFLDQVSYVAIGSIILEKGG